LCLRWAEAVCVCFPRSGAAWRGAAWHRADGWRQAAGAPSLPVPALDFCFGSRFRGPGARRQRAFPVGAAALSRALPAPAGARPQPAACLSYRDVVLTASAFAGRPALPRYALGTVCTNLCRCHCLPRKGGTSRLAFKGCKRGAASQAGWEAQAARRGIHARSPAAGGKAAWRVRWLASCS
jgi:hypothetical protein